MIFVTVGTHEQPFNRLIKDVDDLKGEGIISPNEQVFIQTGFSDYIPKYCEWSKMLSYKKMQQYFREARIVITHGGPSSFLVPLKLGKIPIVMPRCAKYGEHVNDHQLEFVKNVVERYRNIIVVNNKKELCEIITNYKQITTNIFNEKPIDNNYLFCTQLDCIAKQLVD